MARKLKIRDLTLRDGHQSLFATRLQSKHVEQVIEDYFARNYDDSPEFDLTEEERQYLRLKW